MTDPLTSVEIAKKDGERVSSVWWAVIRENGDLEYQRSDYGRLVEDSWGRDEYEANVRVDAMYKDTVLLLLIKDALPDDWRFQVWLRSKGIPYKTSHWP